MTGQDVLSSQKINVSLMANVQKRKFSVSVKKCVPACNNIVCGPQAVCITLDHSPKCTCPPGKFKGDPNDPVKGCRAVGCLTNKTVHSPNSVTVSLTIAWMFVLRTPVARMQYVCLSSSDQNVAVRQAPSLIQWLKLNVQLLMRAARTHVTQQPVVHQLPMAIIVRVPRVRLGIPTKLVVFPKEVVHMVTKTAQIKVYV